MDTVVKYFGYVAFFAVCLYLAFFIASYALISLGETLKKHRHKNRQTDSTGSGVASDEKRVNPIKRLIVNAYDGLYRVLVFKTGRLPLNWLRKLIYRAVFRVEIGKRVTIHKGLEIRGGFNIKIGTGSIIGDDVLLDGRSGLVIGSNVNFSSRASVYSLQHDYQSPDFAANGGRVIIGDRAWVSSNVIVLPDVTIGEGSVVAAGAVVTKDIGEYGLYGGVPAKMLKERSKDLKYEFNGSSCWFL